MAYRQYIHKCSNPRNPNWLTAGESSLVLLPSSRLCPCSDSLILSLTPRRLSGAKPISSPHCQWTASPSRSPLWTRQTPDIPVVARNGAEYINIIRICVVAYLYSYFYCAISQLENYGDSEREGEGGGLLLVFNYFSS